MEADVDVAMEPGAVSAREVNKPSHNPVPAPGGRQGSTRVTEAVAAVHTVSIASTVDGIGVHIAQGDATSIKVAIDSHNGLQSQTNKATSLKQLQCLEIICTFFR